MLKEKFVIVRERIKFFSSNEFGTHKIMGDLKIILWYLILKQKTSIFTSIFGGMF